MQHSVVKNILAASAFLCLLLVCSACSTIEEIPGATGPVENEIVAPSIESPLLALANTATINNPDKNLIQILDVGEEALLARIHLIRSARKNISIQTIIWINDEVGRLIVYELIQAAKRGVKVQLLIDHIASEKNIEIAAFLSAVDPNFEVKLYNPVSGEEVNPSFLSQLQALFASFNRFNQRMHNKIFIVDDAVGITGGRNYQNAYFDQARGLNYKDRDVMVIGPAVREMTASFQAFWDFKRSIRLDDLKDVQQYKKQKEVKIWGSRESFQLHGFFEDIDQRASEGELITKLFSSQMDEVDRAHFIADDPGKNRKTWFSRYSGAGKITRELAKLVENAQNSIYIQTPYLVLSDQAVELFKHVRSEHPDIDIRVSTNSLAATDSWYVYALSYKQKKTYVDSLKFIIYEMKPLPGDMDIMMPTFRQLRNRPLSPSELEKLGWMNDEQRQQQLAHSAKFDLLERAPQAGEPYFCLHAKSMVIDDEIAFIGSYNLDPRSENINTEVGLVIHDPKLAHALKGKIKQDMSPQNSWVINKKKFPLGLTTPNAIMEQLSALIPFVDPWPIRYASSFELMEGKQPVDIDDEDFYDNYRDVGSFPQVSEEGAGKEFGARAVKGFFSFVKPLL